MHFLEWIIPLFLPKSRLHTFVLHFFRKSKTFFKFDSNQLKDIFFLCIFYWELEIVHLLWREHAFYIFFFAIFSPKSSFQAFFCTSETFFQILFLPTFKIFICTSISIDQKKYFLWLEQEFLDFFFLRTTRLQTLVSQFYFCN